MSSQRLSGEEVDAIAQYGARATWPSGFQIYQRATSADGVFVLVQGRVALRSKVKSGRAFAAALVSPGETFGAEGLAPNGTYTTDARAEEECETLFLSGIRFRSFVREQPQQALALLGQIMVERTELLERLHEIATLSVEQRMLATINRLAAAGAFQREDGKLSFDPAQYRLLCELVGATRESVSVVTSRLISEGIAERDGTLLVIAAANAAGTGGDRDVPLRPQLEPRDSASGMNLS
jgi:CRP-like cAMP-binding protein